MDHHPSAVVTADPPMVGPLYTTERSRRAAPRSQRTVQDLDQERELTAVRYGRLLTDSPGRSGGVWRGPEPAHPSLSADASPTPAPAGAAQE